MAIDITPLNPQEIVVLLVALGGVVPILLYTHRISRIYLLAYGFLLVGALMTNLENLAFHDPLNFIEHSVGNMGAGLAFALIAYVERKRLLAKTEATDG